MILRPIVHSKIGCGKLFPELYPQKNPDNINGGCWYAFANEREWLNAGDKSEFFKNPAFFIKMVINSHKIKGFISLKHLSNKCSE